MIPPGQDTYIYCTTSSSFIRNSRYILSIIVRDPALELEFQRQIVPGYSLILCLVMDVVLVPVSFFTSRILLSTSTTFDRTKFEFAPSPFL